MELLGRERETLERFLPGLDRTLADASWSRLETAGGSSGRDNPALGWFRAAGGPALLISRGHGGAGATAWEAVQIQRALGSRSPSLAVATTMHHFSVATIEEICRAGTGLEGILLRAIAQKQLLVASGFAEGRPGAGILDPTLEAFPAEGGLRVSGSKRPCSLTWSMDLLTASVALPRGDGGDGGGRELAVVLVPADSAGLERRPFWHGPALAASESDEVVLHDVLVPQRLVFRLGTPERLDPLQARGFVWFELLIAASYLGIASALVERALARPAGAGGSPRDRAQLAVEVEGAMATLEGMARRLADEPGESADLPRALCVRYAVQQALARVGPLAFEMLGGMAFVGSAEASLLLAASQALAFHPPGRRTGLEALAAALAGEPFLLR
jgi:alkylation response protein AidB-like acyl-CoA dehydrogenase